MLPRPLASHIVEPFAGSAAYSTTFQPERVSLYEANTDVSDLWQWLITSATESDLLSLEKLRTPVKTDVRTFDLPSPQETLMRLTCASVMVGQLSSWLLYPQHRVDFSSLRVALPWIKSSVTVCGSDFREAARQQGSDVVFFIDPPYLGTSGNYIDKTAKRNFGISPPDIADFVLTLECPAIFTYGDGASEMFPQFAWKALHTRRVPNIRAGGSVARTEHVAFVNWPHDSQLSLDAA